MSDTSAIILGIVFVSLSHLAAFHIGWVVHRRMSEKHGKAKTSSAVKPCPHCGSTNLKFVHSPYKHGVTCRKCGFHVYESYMCEFLLAVYKWNKAGEL